MTVALVVFCCRLFVDVQLMFILCCCFFFQEGRRYELFVGCFSIKMCICIYCCILYILFGFILQKRRASTTTNWTAVILVYNRNCSFVIFIILMVAQNIFFFYNILNGEYKIMSMIIININFLDNLLLFKNNVY